MRALTLSAHGGVDRIELRHDLPDPKPPQGREVRIRVTAAALNHLDLFVLEGMPGVTIAPPWIMGADGAGVSDRAGKTGFTGFCRNSFECCWSESRSRSTSESSAMMWGVRKT